MLEGRRNGFWLLSGPTKQPSTGMTSAKEDTLSPDELRKRLYQTFKSKGVLDTLKTQLRNQLIQELKHPPLTGGQPVPRPVHVKSEPRLVSACNSIVADHLRSSGYEYTLSVFYPECGLGKDEVVMTGDLLQLLRINPESALYRSLSADKDNSDKGFLISLLTQLTHYYSHSQCHDADTQTTSGASYGESLVEKMKVIDKEYESLNYSGDKWFSFQSKLDAYRKEIEAQMQEDMNTKMQHFKDVEVATVRMEEKKQFHKEFDKLKQDLERTYEMKAKALMEREKNAIDRLQKQQEIEEKNVYMQRQSVLKEIETVRNRENELRMRVEAFEKTCQIHEQKVKTTEELLRSKELAVKTMEETYDQRLRNELSRYQLELKDEFLKRTEKLTENENIIKVESVRIQKESAIIDGKLEEHCRASSELRRLQVELDTAQQQISLLTQQNGLLRERLEATSDYSSLKGEKAELQGQQRLLKKQLEEAQEENRLLHADSGRPSKQQLALQMELRRLQSARSLDEEAFENQKQVLQAQLQGEVERGAQLKAQLTECEERSRWMTNHIEEMKMQLRQTQQALENEVLRNPKPSLVDRSILEFSTDKLLPPDIYVDRALLRATVVCDEVREAGGPLRGRRSPWSDSPDTDLDLVAEAKARIQELQEEAETLEEAYRNYHQRAVRSTISPVLPLGPRSPQRASPSRRPGSPLRKQAAQHPHARSPNRPKVSQRPLSPRTARTLSSAPCDTRTTPHVQQRVTFLEDADQPQSAILSDHSPHSLTETLRDGRPQAANSPPPRRLSPTPHSSSRNTLQREIAEEAVGSPMALPELSLDRRAPPHSDLATTGDFSPELSPPCSPQLKSTTRDQSSPPKLQPVFSSSDSSPQPEKISLDDLTVMSEPGHIPQLLLDTAIPLCAEAPDSPTVPRPQDLPEDPMELQGQAEVPQASGEDAMIQEDNDDEEEEEEEERWERERRKRLEERQRKQAEAREREVQELERLEKEMLLQEMEQPELKQGEEGEAEIKKKEEEQAQGAANDGEEPMGGNPLEKYMALVLEAREKQHDQSPGREEAGRVSPEAEGLSEEKDNSVAAFSHKDEDEDDDDFW